ncbi:PCMD domain-containing protein [Chitinophaga solisilvae]|uniref:PCMD domain-containing protein n=1 Tax=Chitinophaga solisilvae TaxID=1233460 RepID=UPI001371DDA9|nr:PCMD domain-containing protein [Chitinophaga solisilvae]
MKLRKLCCVAAMIGSLQACIKDAPLNPEADIVTFKVDEKQLTGQVFIDQSKASINLYVTPEALKSGIVPQITITPGATITKTPAGPLTAPASDTLHFDTITGRARQQFIVTAANGASSRTYSVRVVTTGIWQWDFENWVTDEKEKYQYPIEKDSAVLWSSGNPGIAIALTGTPKSPEAYPLRMTTDAYHGKGAAEMQTRAGTALSNLVGIKLFAGSMFLGVFDIANAFGAPLEATQFGQPSRGNVVRFTGYYKYTPGAFYQDREGNKVDGKTDECSLYAVLYTGTKRLDATNIHTSDRVIARATLADGTAKAGWTSFDIPFVYTRKAVAGEQYMLAIVASSSKNGDSYEGAVGSRLVLDSLEIVHE